MLGLAFGNWVGVYSHVAINGTNRKHRPNRNVLQSVHEENYINRRYLVFVADNPEKRGNTGNQVADIEAACMPCEYIKNASEAHNGQLHALCFYSQM